MKTIWKFPVPMDGYFLLKMPAGSRVLDVQMQGGVPMLWALCESDAPRENRAFTIIGTGRSIPDKLGNHVGTWQDSGFVWHLFEAP